MVDVVLIAHLEQDIQADNAHEVVHDEQFEFQLHVYILSCPIVFLPHNEINCTSKFISSVFVAQFKEELLFSGINTN